MEIFAWRYEPEFILTTLIDGQPAGERIDVVPAAVNDPAAGNDLTAGPATAGSSFIIRKEGGRAAVFGRRLREGTSWVPPFEGGLPVTFTFWLKVRPGTPFRLPVQNESPAISFGLPVFYTSNLSGTGEVDPGLAGNAFELPSAAAAENTAVLCTRTPSAGIPAGEYTVIRAGKVRAGEPVDYHFSETLGSSRNEAALDFRLLPGGTYMVRLEGAADLNKRLVVNETALAAGMHGVVDIYRDSWRAPAAPLEYRMNFIT